MKVVAHINIPEGGLLERAYYNVHGDPLVNAAGVTFRNVNGGIIAILPWASLASIEIPENDTNLVQLPVGITSALSLSN